MKKHILIPILLIVVILTAFSVLTQWKADSKGTSINFMFSGKMGGFGNMESNIEFDPNQLQNSKISATVDVNSLKIAQGMEGFVPDEHPLRQHLLSSDYFHASKFPTIIIASTEIVTKDKIYLFKGKLTMKDSTKNITFPFTFSEQDNKGIFSGTIQVNCSDFGFSQIKPGNEPVKVLLNVPVSK